MSSTVTQSTDFNTNNINFSQIKVMESGAKQAYLNYDGRALTMQTASMSVPYGMNVFDKAGPVKYSVDLSFRGYEDQSPKNKIRNFYNAMTQLDEFMVQQGVKNCQAWFKSKLTEDVVRAFYTPIVRVSKDANGNPKPYPPTLKVSLRKKNGTDRFEVDAFDADKQPYKTEDGAPTPLEELLVKGAQMTVLIQCTGLWFAGSKFGLSWKAAQIRVDKLPDSLRGFAFADDEDAPRTSGRAITGGGQQRLQMAPAPAPAPVAIQEEVNDDDVFDEAPAPAARQSVLAAVVQPQTLDDDAEDAEPIAVPQKKVVMTKKTVTKVTAGAKKA
jgi:hypothetical protein